MADRCACGANHALLPDFNLDGLRCPAGCKPAAGLARVPESRRYVRCRDCGAVAWHDGKALRLVTDAGLVQLYRTNVVAGSALTDTLFAVAHAGNARAKSSDGDGVVVWR